MSQPAESPPRRPPDRPGPVAMLARRVLRSTAAAVARLGEALGSRRRATRLAARRDIPTQWKVGLREEVSFWDRWLQEQGSQWPEDYRRRLRPDYELQPHVARFLDGAEGPRLKVLDVGCGPLTVLGKVLAGRTLEITGVDPLAGSYAELYRSAGIEPLVRPVAGEAEHVAEMFPGDTFDLAYAQNCLDHGYDPLRSIQQMLAVVKPGRFVFLEHAINEGEFMKYAGPHQWNFHAPDGRFEIWRPGAHTDAHSILERSADIEIESIPDLRWIRIALRKKPPDQQVG